MPDTTDQSEVSAEAAARKAYSAAAETVGISKASADAPGADHSPPDLSLMDDATPEPVVEPAVAVPAAKRPVGRPPGAKTSPVKVGPVKAKAGKAAVTKAVTAPVIARAPSKPAKPAPVETAKAEPGKPKLAKAKAAKPKVVPKVVKAKSIKPAAAPIAAITPTTPSSTPTAKIKEKPAMATATKTVTVPDVMKIVTEAQTKAKEAFSDVQGKAMHAFADVQEKAKEAAADVEAKAKLAYAKGSEVAGKVGTIVKSNVEAAVESSKTLGFGLKELGETTVEDSRAAMQTFADDLKDFASLKSPAEFFQLQGKLAARNVDAYFAYATKSGKAVKDLTEKTIAPISAQIKANVAAARKAA
jgi:hypothetical protein